MVGTILREIRHKLFLTQKDMASLLSVPVGTYKNWERDAYLPCAERMEMLCERLDAISSGSGALMRESFVVQKLKNGV